ncbi:MAG: hypothetical protein R3C19_14390 [Planctomycetaceae bacterium]
MMASGSQSATVQSHNGMAQESGVQQAQFMPSPQQSSMRDGQLKPVQFSQPMPPGCAAPCNTGPMMMSGTPVLPGMQIQEYPAETMLPMDMSSDCARQQAELRQQTVQLQQKMAALERRLESEQEAKQDLTASLESMNGEMDRMSQEIGYWRNETRRVEQSFEEQHQHDIAALDAIVELVEQVPDPYATSRGNGLPALPPATHGAP